MQASDTTIQGAREHNLQSVDVVLPRNQLICLTGVSGSGKSSLAFDTLFAEGQRRYLESLSSFARHFIGQMPKPDVDVIAGLTPSISISQKTAGRNPRSTVGTITEIYDFLRVLYARVGVGNCPQCQAPITAQTREQIISHIMQLAEGTAFSILAPVIRGQKGEHRDLFEDLLKQGYIRARVDGDICELMDPPSLDRRFRHHIEVVVDRLTASASGRGRLSDAVDQALRLGSGDLIVAAANAAAESDAATDIEKPTDDKIYSSDYACTHCNLSFPAPTPQLFSFNSPQGMCDGCGGLGQMFSFDSELMVPNPAKSFKDGCFELLGNWKKLGRWKRHIYQGVADTVSREREWADAYLLETPWQDLSQEAKDVLLWGTGELHITYTWRGGNSPMKYGGKYEGLIPELKSKYGSSKSRMQMRRLERYMSTILCPECHGDRLVAQARHMLLQSSHSKFVESPQQSLPAVCRLSVNDAVEFFSEMEFDSNSALIAEEPLKEIRNRLGFLVNVGLGYLTLDRTAPTLSGGEAQRIRLAAQIGSGLVGITYILDEPSIGLHSRDNDRLLQTLVHLRDIGNTVVVVEHDEETMRIADYVVDFGPGAGVKGGEIVARGTIEDIRNNTRSVTGQFLAGTRKIEIPQERRGQNEKQIQILGAQHNNLKSVDISIPLENFVCVTGVSGSGKSSLVNDILSEALRRDLNGGDGVPGAHLDLLGSEHLDKMIAIDQSAIGRTPRSNPSTYIKVFDDIRKLFTQLPDSKRRGYKPGRFSFNVKGGRCEACEGNGTNKLEMDFLADVWVTCPVCEGKRFNRETLHVKFKGYSISDILEMDVAAALELFENIPNIHHKLKTLQDVGLDYLKLGQPSPTLSGGEAQRIKLARELVKKSTGSTLYLLDEPTTGLHFADIQLLLKVLHAFVNSGNTVLVVEHNLDVIKTADWVIDLGPAGGAGGGELLIAGTPEDVAACKESYTGIALARLFSAEGEQNIINNNLSDRSPAEQLKNIRVRGAQQHNLKLVDVDIVRDKMTVFSGPSGSGKTSLAMDTIYAEGQRRYVESLSSYARQFISQTQKPRLDHIDGLSPAIAIEQKNLGHTPRSTVGTITEIYDYLRILMARIGIPYCPDCQIPVGTQTTDQIVDKIMSEDQQTRLYLMAPLDLETNQDYSTLWDEVRQSGFIRVRIDQQTYNLDELPELDRRSQHAIEVVVDRIKVRDKDRARIAESVEAALQIGRGVLHVAYVSTKKDEPQWQVVQHSQHLSCEDCGRSFQRLSPHNFSFNSHLGWCESCEGLGTQRGANPAALLGNTQSTLLGGAVALWPDLQQTMAEAMMRSLMRDLEIDDSTSFDQLTSTQRRSIMHGTGSRWFAVDISMGKRKQSFKFQFKGLYPALEQASRVSPSLRNRLEHLVDQVECSTCGGSRLRDFATAYRFQDQTMEQLCRLPLEGLLELVINWKLPKRIQAVAGELLLEIQNRLEFLNEIGLYYLTLDRPAASLSNGEAQRIRLASQLGSGLCGVLYVLDEPTIGLHPRDNSRLLQALNKLRDLGNTLLVVEHDSELIQGADYLCDFGPGSGQHGGNVVAHGTPAKLAKQRKSVTGPYLSGKKTIPIPSNRRPVFLQGKTQSQFLAVRGVRHHNLKDVDLVLPTETLTVVTGPSGSGKSSLIDGVLYAALAKKLHRTSMSPGSHDHIEGLEFINKVIRVDQNALGNSPSSNPATYTGVFDLIRTLFAQLPDAKLRGFTARRFSFNVPGGRCDDCDGYGNKRIEMHFLPDVWIQCQTCDGQRYNPDTLEVKFRGQSIADVLKMTCAEAVRLFDNIPKIRRILQMLCDVGLDYVALGQPAPTLSGGEAQRVKLAAELARPDTGRTLYLLDEPTTGLHFADIEKLLDVLHRLVDLGNTVVVIEHNLDLIKTADWVIDIGPEAGFAGGQIVAAGTPEDVAQIATKNKPTKTASQKRSSNKAVLRSYTGEALVPVLAAGPYVQRKSYVVETVELQSEELDLAEVGKDIPMPWKTNGRRWHTQDRVARDGSSIQWEGQILADTIDRIQEQGDFSETDFGARTVVEIAAPTKTHGWFFHAITAEKWLVKMKFRMAPGTFKRDELVSQLNLRTLNQMDDLPVYGNEPRVKVKKRAQWQEVEIRAYSYDEIDTQEFWDFITTAVRGFKKMTSKTQKNSDHFSPWKKQGEKWHFSRKGFHPGHKVKWKMEVWEELYQMMQEILPEGNFLWNNKVYVHMYLPGGRYPWLTVKTKKAEKLMLVVTGFKGQVTAGRVAELGNAREMELSRPDRDSVTLSFNEVEDLYRGDLEGFLREHLAGIREQE